MIVKGSKQGEVTFVFDRIPSAKNVYLAGTFNEWDPAQKKMTRSKDGTFKAKMKLLPGKYEYKFIVDGQWIDDPEAAKAVNEFGSTNSVVEIAGKQK
jgi:1,4-alpha-glucan branching enzyme